MHSRFGAWRRCYCTSARRSARLDRSPRSPVERDIREVISGQAGKQEILEQRRAAEAAQGEQHGPQQRLLGERRQRALV
jgi:hypothetical protein